MAISVTLFRASNIYGGADIVNNQQFNESRLRHMEQATSVKSLIDCFFLILKEAALQESRSDDLLRDLQDVLLQLP